MQQKLWRSMTMTYIIIECVIFGIVCANAASVKYFHVTEANRTIAIQVGITCVVVPVVILFLLVFIGKRLGTLEKRKIAVFSMAALCVISVAVSILFAILFLLGGGICSVTNDISNYGLYDEHIGEQLENHQLPFPEQIDEETCQYSYSYSYIQTLDDEVEITLQCTYSDKAVFNKMIEEICSGDYVKTETQGDVNTYYLADSEIKSYIELDTVTMRILYGYAENSNSSNSVGN